MPDGSNATIDADVQAVIEDLLIKTEKMYSNLRISSKAMNSASSIAKFVFSTVNDERADSNSPLGLIIDDSPASSVSAGSLSDCNLEKCDSLSLLSINAEKLKDRQFDVKNVLFAELIQNDNERTRSNSPNYDLPPQLTAERIVSPAKDGTVSPKLKNILPSPNEIKKNSNAVSIPLKKAEKSVPIISPLLVTTKPAINNSLAKLALKVGGEKKPRNLLPKPLINNGVSKTVFSKAPTTLISNINATTPSSAVNFGEANGSGKELAPLSKILPKKVKSSQTTLPIMFSSNNNNNIVQQKNQLPIQKRVVKPKPLNNTTKPSEKCVQEIVADMVNKSTSSLPPTSSANLTNTIDTLMSEVLQSAAQAVGKPTGCVSDILPALAPVKARKRAPQRARKKDSALDPQVSCVDQKTGTTNSFLVPNMIFPNQLTMAPGNLIAMPGCMQQYVIQPSPTNQQNGNNTNGLIPLMPSQHLFLAPASVQQQQLPESAQSATTRVNSSQTTANVNGIIGSSAGSTNSNMAILSQPQLSSASIVSAPMYFRLNSANNGIIMPVSGSPGVFRNTNLTQVNSVGFSSATSQSYSQQSVQNTLSSSLKFIQPKISSNLVGGSSRSILPNPNKNINTSIANISALVSTPRMATACASNNNINNNNNSVVQQQIFCLPHPQQQQHSQQFLTPTSLSNQQLAQLGAFPIMSAGGANGSAGMSRILQLAPTIGTSSFPIMAANSVLSNQASQSLATNLHGSPITKNVLPSKLWPTVSSEDLLGNDRLHASISSVASASSLQFNQQTKPTTSSSCLSLSSANKQRCCRKKNKLNDSTTAKKLIDSPANNRLPNLHHFSTVDNDNNNCQYNHCVTASVSPNSSASVSLSAQSSSNAENVIEEEENEPPPLLCRDELVSIQNSFLKEAEMMRQQFFHSNGTKTRATVKHMINNLVIEENIDPFPCDNAELLNEMNEVQLNNNCVKGVKADDESSEEEDESKKAGLENNSDNGDKNPTDSRKRKLFDKSFSDDKTVLSHKDEESRPLPLKRKGRRGGNCELKGLLTMDFGPGKTPFQTTSIERYTEEVILEARQQQRCLAFEEGLVKRSSETSSTVSERNSPQFGGKRGRKRMSEEQCSSPGLCNFANGNQPQDESGSPTPTDYDTKKTADKLKESEKVKSDEYKRQEENREMWGDERCICCQQRFCDLGRRHLETPQYCSKMCRKKSKKQQKIANCLNTIERNATNQAATSIFNDSTSSAMATTISLNNNIPIVIPQKSVALTMPVLNPPNLSSEKLLPKLLPSTSNVVSTSSSPPSTSSSPSSALFALRRNIGITSSPTRGATSAFSLKMRTPQKPNECPTSLNTAHSSTSINAKLSPDWPPRLQPVIAPVSTVPSTAMMQPIMHMIGPSSSGVMSFIPTAGQLSSMSGGISNYPFYTIQQEQQQTIDSFYQQHQQMQKRDSTSSIGQQPALQSMMMFPVPGTSAASSMGQSSPIILPITNNAPQPASQLHFVVQQNNSLNNNRGSNVSSPVPTTPHSATPTAVMTFSGERGAELQQLQLKGVQNWTPAEVGRWAGLVTNSDANGDRFVQNEIDGEALILLNTAQFQSELGLKLGPAVKLNNALNTLDKPISPAYLLHPEVQSLIVRGIHNWTAEDVGRWVNVVTNSEENGEKFVQQEIDGASLTLLKSQQYQNELDFKLGPSLKLNAALNLLQF